MLQHRHKRDGLGIIPKYKTHINCELSITLVYTAQSEHYLLIFAVSCRYFIARWLTGNKNYVVFVSIFVAPEE